MAVRDRAAARTDGPPFASALALLVCVVVLLAIPAAGVPFTTPGTLAPTQVMSRLERAGKISLGRDCGYSQPLPTSPGRSLWLFCDTPVYQRVMDAGGHVTWVLSRFITGSTAAVGPTVASGAASGGAGRGAASGAGPGGAGAAPGALSEVATAATGRGARSGAREPAPFLPPPAGLVTPAGLPCDQADGGYAASWISGVTRMPASYDLLIVFDNYCVLAGTGGFLPEGFGLVEYDPATGALSNEAAWPSGTGPGPASAGLLGSPVFSGPYLYLFGPACTAIAYGGCARGTVSEVRVGASPRDWTDRFRYQWWIRGPDGPWSPDAAAANSIIEGARPSAVSVADFTAIGHGFVLVEQTDIGGGFIVYESPVPGGPWRRVRSGRVPCGAGHGYVNFCRAIIGHAELSSTAQLVLSYFDPAAGARGHVMVAGFRW